MAASKKLFGEIRVLLLEDSLDMRGQISRMLENSGLGFTVDAIPSSSGLTRKLMSRKFDALVIDYDLSIGDADTVIRTAKEFDPFLPIVLISRTFIEEIYADENQLGADSYLPLTEISPKIFPRALVRRIKDLNIVREAIDYRRQSVLKSYEVDILASLVKKMTETNDLKSVMQDLAEQIVRKLEVKVVALQRYVPLKKGFAVYGIYPQGKLVRSAEMYFGISLDSFVFPFDPDNCIVDQYTMERRAWVGTDFSDVFGTTMPAQAARMIQKFAGVKSIYNAPFYSKDQLLGGILVGNVRDSFTPEELEAFNAIVQTSSFLFEYHGSVEGQITQSRKLQAIHEASTQLHENLRPEKIFEIIYERSAPIVPADIVRLFLYDRESRTLREQKAFLSKGRQHSSIVPEIPMGKGLVGIAALRNESVLENYAQLNPESFYAGDRPELEHLLAVPISYQDELQGMLVMIRLKDEPFSESDRDALEIFASQLAIALNNSKRYEDLLRSETLYRLVLESVDDPVALVGIDGKLLYVNRKFEEASGYASGEVLGRDFRFLIHPDDWQFVVGQFQTRLSGRPAPGKSQFRFVTKTGEVRTADYTVATITIEGRITGVLGIARDITGA